jgi:hypothetical protein
MGTRSDRSPGQRSVGAAPHRPLTSQICRPIAQAKMCEIRPSHSMMHEMKSLIQLFSVAQRVRDEFRKVK